MYQKDQQHHHYNSPQIGFDQNWNDRHHYQEHYPHGGVGFQNDNYQNQMLYDDDDRFNSIPMVNADAKYHSSDEFFGKKPLTHNEYTELNNVSPVKALEEYEEESDEDNSTTSENSNSDPDYVPDAAPTDRKTRQPTRKRFREESVSSVSTVGDLVQAIKKPRKAAAKKNELAPKARGYHPKTQQERDDPKYQAKRAKNNDAVRKSRFKAKQREDQKMARAEKAEQEIVELKEENRKLKALIEEQAIEIRQLKGARMYVDQSVARR